MIVKPQFHRNKESSYVGNRISETIDSNWDTSQKSNWKVSLRICLKTELQGKAEKRTHLHNPQKTNKQTKTVEVNERGNMEEGRIYKWVLMALLFRWFYIFYCKKSFMMCLYSVMHTNIVVDQCCLKTLQKCLLLHPWIVGFTSIVNILSLVCMAQNGQHAEKQWNMNIPKSQIRQLE